MTSFTVSEIPESVWRAILNTRARYNGTAVQFYPEFLENGVLWTAKCDYPNVIIERCENFVDAQYARETVTILQQQLGEQASKLNSLHERARTLLDQKDRNAEAEILINNVEIQKTEEKINELQHQIAISTARGVHKFARLLIPLDAEITFKVKELKPV